MMADGARSSTFRASNRAGYEWACPPVRLQVRHQKAKMTELRNPGMREAPEDSETHGTLRPATARAAARAANAASRVGASALNVVDNIPYGNIHMSLTIGPPVRSSLSSFPRKARARRADLSARYLGPRVECVDVSILGRLLLHLWARRPARSSGALLSAKAGCRYG